MEIKQYYVSWSGKGWLDANARPTIGGVIVGTLVLPIIAVIAVWDWFFSIEV